MSIFDDDQPESFTSNLMALLGICGGLFYPRSFSSPRSLTEISGTALFL
jgi:hypothetical protein